MNIFCFFFIPNYYIEFTRAIRQAKVYVRKRASNLIYSFQRTFDLFLKFSPENELFAWFFKHKTNYKNSISCVQVFKNQLLFHFSIQDLIQKIFVWAIIFKGNFFTLVLICSLKKISEKKNTTWSMNCFQKLTYERTSLAFFT